MAKFDSAKTMKESILKEQKTCWQCQDCGKIYPSLQALDSAPCQAHKGTQNCDCGKDAIDNFNLFWSFASKDETFSHSATMLYLLNRKK